MQLFCYSALKGSCQDINNRNMGAVITLQKKSAIVTYIFLSQMQSRRGFQQYFTIRVRKTDTWQCEHSNQSQFKFTAFKSVKTELQ